MIAPSETPSQRNFRLIGEAAEIVTGWPLTRERLRAAHRPGADGRCRGCTSQTRRAPHWPRALALLVRGADPDFTHPARPSHNARLV